MIIDPERLMKERDRVVNAKMTTWKELALKHKFNEDYIYVIRNNGRVTNGSLKKLLKIGFKKENIIPEIKEEVEA